MNNEDLLRKERDKLGNQLQAIPGAHTGDNAQANAIIDKITSLNLALGKHPMTRRPKPTPTFIKTYK